MYGEGQNPNSILAQLDSAIDKKMTKFNMSGGEQIRDYMHVEDVAKSILKIIAHAHIKALNCCRAVSFLSFPVCFKYGLVC